MIQIRFKKKVFKLGQKVKSTDFPKPDELYICQGASESKVDPREFMQNIQIGRIVVAETYVTWVRFGGKRREGNCEYFAQYRVRN